MVNVDIDINTQSISMDFIWDIWVVEIEIPRFFWFGLRVFFIPMTDPWDRYTNQSEIVRNHHIVRANPGVVFSKARFFE